MKRFLRSALSGIVAIALCATAASPAHAGDPAITVVASGLDNPRGITVGPGGVLLVAEAGSGGAGPCVTTPGNANGVWCLGMTGSVTAVVPPGIPSFLKNPATKSPQWWQYRVVTGLPSLASTIDGDNAVGVEHMTIRGTKVYATLGLGGDQAFRSGLGSGGQLLGRVVELQPLANPPVSFADLLPYELAYNPDGGDAESNPYGLLGNADGSLVVTDAAGNTVLGIGADGAVSTITALPARPVDAPPFLGLPAGTTLPMQSVPTTVARGPDGALYIGEFTGFPFQIGGARVWRIPAGGGTPTVAATGFTNIIDIAFDKQGRLLVLELAKNSILTNPAGVAPAGRLTRLSADGSRQELAAGQLFGPGGIAVGPDGAIYVSNYGVLGDGHGQVVRIRP